MGDKSALVEEMQAACDRLNSVKWRPDDCYQFELGEHNQGPAIDLKKDGEPPTKVMGQFTKAAMRAGYVVTATQVNNQGSSMNHTRIFLGDVEEYFDLAGDGGYEQGVEDGAMAVLWLLSLAAVQPTALNINELYPTIEDDSYNEWADFFDQ